MGGWVLLFATTNGSGYYLLPTGYYLLATTYYLQGLGDLGDLKNESIPSFQVERPPPRHFVHRCKENHLLTDDDDKNKNSNNNSNSNSNSNGNGTSNGNGDGNSNSNRNSNGNSDSNSSSM